VKPIDELKALAEELSKLNSSTHPVLNKLKETAEEVGKSWSGSWLGYQARIYYADFIPVPAGACFSIEWGFMDRFSNETRGNWHEHEFNDVINYIHEIAGIRDVMQDENECRCIKKAVENAKIKAKSILSIFVRNRDDVLLNELTHKLEKTKFYTVNEILKSWSPKGQIMSRDMIAMGQGFKTPPHFAVQAQMVFLLSHYSVLQEFIDVLIQIISHIDRIEHNPALSNILGDKIFIGHGNSLQWMKLKDFIEQKLELSYDEFNRVPVAGVTNIARLQEMLNNAQFAFLIMTAEDEQKDGALRARMNVIHEVGLFQGKLGFSHAIVVLEDGCEEFSNIEGLGQIRFTKGKIQSCFEEVREVLLHHKIIDK